MGIRIWLERKELGKELTVTDSSPGNVKVQANYGSFMIKACPEGVYFDLSAGVLDAQLPGWCKPEMVQKVTIHDMFGGWREPGEYCRGDAKATLTYRKDDIPLELYVLAPDLESAKALYLAIRRERDIAPTTPWPTK